MDAAAMQLERHGWGIHVVRPGTGDATVTGAHSCPCVPPQHDNKLNGIEFQQHERGIHVVPGGRPELARRFGVSGALMW
jgi:hypothetical protein